MATRKANFNKLWRKVPWHDGGGEFVVGKKKYPLKNHG